MASYSTDNSEIAEILRRLLTLVNYVSDLLPKGSGLALALAESAIKPYAESNLQKDAEQLRDDVKGVREFSHISKGELKVVRDSLQGLERKLGSQHAGHGRVYPREVTPQLRRHVEQAATHAMNAERLLDNMLHELQKLRQEVHGTKKWLDQAYPKLGEIERYEKLLLDRWLGPGKRP